MGNPRKNTSSPEGAKESGNVLLGDITETRVDQTGPNGKEFTYVDIGSIELDTKRIVDPKVLPVSKAPSRAKQVLKRGDVLVSMTRPNRNAVALVPPELDGAIGSTGFHVLRAKDVEPGFLFYAVQTNDFIDSLCQKVQGALYPAVRPRDISSFKTFLPSSRHEQRRIVAEIEKQFTRLEAGVTALRRVQANLKRYRAAVLKAACEGRLVPTEAELHRKRVGRVPSHGVGRVKSKGNAASGDAAYNDVPFETGAELLARILTERRKNWQGRGKYKEPAAPDTANLPSPPEGWMWASADQISSQITDGEHIQPKYTDVGYPMLSAKHVRNGFVIYTDVPFISEADFKACLKRCAPTRDDILIVCVGATTGRTAIVGDAEPFAVVRSVLLIRTMIHPRFMLAWVQSPWCQTWIQRASGSSAQAHFYINNAKQMCVPLPPLAEQTRIVAEVERRLSVVEELESVASANLQRATRLRQSILQKAFTGELVAWEAAAQPAVELPKTESRQRPNRHFARALLSAEIVHRLHNEPTFGRIKHQKIFHLCEHIAQIKEIEGQYHREVAGPLDNKLIYANEAELKKQKWYQEVHRNLYGHAYKPLAKAGVHRKYVEGYWPDKLPVVETLIELMRTWDTDRCEIFCTVYAAWNDLILWGTEPTETAILHEILERWHESKRRFPKERWCNAIRWMKEKGFVPAGFGKPTTKPA